MENKILKAIQHGMIRVFIIPIRIYQYGISPLTPHTCRHIPTCSNYTIEAIQIHGVIKGIFLGFRRIIRCHPWGTHGYDPVPPRKKSAG